MFRDTRRKKLRNRVLFAALGVCVLTLGIWLNYSVVTDEDGSEEAANNVKVEETEASDAQREEDTNSDGSDTSGEKDESEEKSSYLVKEVDGVIKVFECQGDEKELYLITSIPYELLSENDQQMFAEGVNMDTEEELGEFLENFDS